MIFQVFLALFAVCNAQKLIDLKSFKGQTDTQIDATGPYSIYVSASSDDDALLNKMTIKSSDNKVQTLLSLKNAKVQQNTGLLQPFAITNSAVLSSSLTNDQMSKLTGTLYITTAQQLQNNKGFYVFNVETSEKVTITGDIYPDDVTLVFLNTNYKDQPFMSSTISAWKQAEGSSVYIYEGIPKDTDEKANSQIFSNPVLLQDKSMKFIPSVEIFSLNLGAFYIKSHKGIQFVIEPTFNDIDNSVTSSKTTTGFYMKPIANPDRKVTIKTGHDNDYQGMSGVNVLGSVPANANFGVTGPGNWATTPSETIHSWSAATIADTLSLETTNCVAGEVFVQYYVIQGAENVPSTTMLPGRQTTARIQSTTKSTALIQLFTSVLIPIVGARTL
ncbi:hypothetical protein L5515_008084 [Caenorhabditis briggsae]|uniref:Uncharacterized protein n=1 Tax=Caenorhabditis briggsae TaxID=6238 RepID=A0AAE9F502_CAEBR|nr:hypothetical protein L5515_008084 [Caenorhabditis briggsae]